MKLQRNSLFHFHSFHFIHSFSFHFISFHFHFIFVHFIFSSNAAWEIPRAIYKAAQPQQRHSNTTIYKAPQLHHSSSEQCMRNSPHNLQSTIIAPQQHHSTTTTPEQHHSSATRVGNSLRKLQNTTAALQQHHNNATAAPKIT